MKKLFLVCCVMGCGSGTMDDTVDDSGIDTGKPDTGIDGAKIDSGKDSGADSGMDAASDAPDDSAMDAASDVMVGDGGILGLQGLVLWLDAAKGVTKNNNNQVSKWADQSGNSNDAAQGSSTLQPVYNASVINGLPALHFTTSNTGSQLTITDSQTLQWGTGDWLVEVVARFDNTPSTQSTGWASFYVKPGMNAGVVLTGNAIDPTNMMNPISAGVTGAIGPNDYVPAKASYNDNTARSYAFRRVGQSLEIRVNGAQVTSKNQSSNIDVSASGINVAIGQYMNGGIMDGDIAEMVGVKGSISNSDLAIVEAYLKSKYNL
jgi:hypothetical protein